MLYDYQGSIQGCEPPEVLREDPSVFCYRPMAKDEMGTPVRCSEKAVPFKHQFHPGEPFFRDLFPALDVFFR